MFILRIVVTTMRATGAWFLVCREICTVIPRKSNAATPWGAGWKTVW
jgi:hypothetical protein